MNIKIFRLQFEAKLVKIHNCTLSESPDEMISIIKQEVNEK